MRKTMSWLASVAAAVLAAGVVNAAEPATAKSPWPLWDGKESVADYAKRAGIAEVQKELDLGGGVSLKLTLIPAGKFKMGAPDERREVVEGVEVVVQGMEFTNGDWMMPDHEVTLSRPFYMGIYEVTQEQYAQIMGDTWDSRYKMGWQSQVCNNIASPEGYTKGKTYPECLLLWEEAAEFCDKVSAKTGSKVWLPTEAQWEWACKAGSKPNDSWYGGPKDKADFHNYENFVYINTQKKETLATAKATSGFRGIAPVGSFKPNPWGLYDMICNVREWCHDWYWRYHDDAPALDPTGPGISPPDHWHTGLMHVWRSDIFSSHYGYPGSVGRPFEWDGSKHRGPGFRVVVAMKSTDERALGTKAENPSKASVATAAAKDKILPKAPATTGPADPNVRVPAGCRAAAGTKAESYTKSGWAQAIVHEATGMEMVYIPAGKFLMGTPPDTTPLQPQSLLRRRAIEEKPHRVTLTKGFYMGKYEVTQAQWEKIMGHNPSLFKNVGPEAPVDTVFWAKCQEFCKKAGGGLRLPTEAEWEYACRAGTKEPYAGDLAQMGWYFENSNGTTHPVGTKKPNAWGLHDMHGNVWEWCQDYWGTASREAVTDPSGPATGGYGNPHVIRGGGWGDYGPHCISAIRGGFTTDRNQTFLAVGCRFVIPAGGAQ
ncbi:MAG: hypothetical protein FJ225_02485 [Lentisphaerae bacterium]|nr:hypothetical protein [Lentisphaerota bacterium]